MPEDAFDTAFKGFGPRWRPNTNHPGGRAIIRFSTNFQDLIDFYSKSFNHPPIQCGIIANPSFNALATSDGPNDFVAIFGGALNFIFTVYSTFLSDPEVLILIGDSSAQIIKQDALEAIRVGRVIETSDHVPKDKDRLRAAHDLTLLSCAFILLHEAAHVTYCHPMFFEEKLGTKVYREMAPLDCNQEEIDLRMAFEWEADELAAEISYQLTHFLFTEGLPGLQKIHPDRIYGLAVSMVFLLIALLSGGSLNLQSVTHPRPLFRYISSMMRVEKSRACKAFSPSNTLLMQGHEDALTFFLRNNINLSFGGKPEAIVKEMEFEHKKVNATLVRERAILERIAADRSRALHKNVGC